MSMINQIILAILFSIALFLIVALFNRNLYCMVFCHKERKLWKKFIKEYQNFECAQYNDKYVKKLFLSKDNKYQIYIWHNGLCSVFDGHDRCLLSDFDKKMSKIMADKLNSL